jgi:hypothetical protein
MSTHLLGYERTTLRRKDGDYWPLDTAPLIPVAAWSVALEFKPQDLWIGAYWHRSEDGLDVWVCLLPMLPIHVWRRA